MDRRVTSPTWGPQPPQIIAELSRAKRTLQSAMGKKMS